MDKKLVGVIEKASDGGYGIYALEDVIPVTGYGLTEEEAKKDFVNKLRNRPTITKKKKVPIPSGMKRIWKWSIGMTCQPSL